MDISLEFVITVVIIIVQAISSIAIVLVANTFKTHEKENEKESRDRIVAQAELADKLTNLTDKFSVLKEDVVVLKSERKSDEKFYAMHLRQSNQHTDSEINVIKIEMENLKKTINENLQLIFNSLNELKQEKPLNK